MRTLHLALLACALAACERPGGSDPVDVAHGPAGGGAGATPPVPTVVTPTFDYLEDGVSADPTLRPGATLAADGPLPVPARLPESGLLPTEDGLLAHGRGARLFRAGRVVEGDVVRTSARLLNRSQRPLRLQRIEGECECVEALAFRLRGDVRLDELVPGDEVLPGEEFEVQVHLDTSGRAGEMQLEGILDYAGAARPLKFAIQCEVVPIFALDPPDALVVDGVLLGERHTAQAVVTSPVAGAFRLAVDDRALPAFLALRVVPIEPDAEGYAERWRATLVVSERAPDAPLPWTREVVLEVTERPSSDAPVPVSHVRTLPVGYRTSLPVELMQTVTTPEGKRQVAPASTLVVGRLEPGATAELRAFLVVRDGAWRPEGDLEVGLVEPARVGGAPLPEGALAWRWERGKGGNPVLVVAVSRPEDGPTGPLDAQLEVRVGHPALETLRLRVSAIFR